MISVLYVDDEQSLLEIAKLFLEDTGEFRVGTAISAKTALKDDSVRSYDAIVSDYQMPGMDGIAFLKIVREKYGDIPFILFTGRGREEIVIEAINNGADFYLQKGGDPESQFAELAHKLRQSVRRKQAERSLQISYEQIRTNEERLIMAQEISHTGSWEFTILTNELWVSQEGLRLFGFHRPAGPVSAEETDACIPERERVHQALNDLITKERKYELEFVIHPADGSAPRLIHSSARLERDSAGNPVRVLGVVLDITDKKQREDELAFSNALLSTEQDTSLDAILVVGEDGRIVNYNRQFTALWGIPDDLVAKRDDKPVLQYVTRQLADPEAFLSRVRYLYEHRDEKSSEELLLKDGRVLERFSAPMMGQNGRYYGRIWYFRDITRRKRAEQELQRSEARLRQFIQLAPTAIAMFDREMRYIAVSRRWIADYHLGDQDIVGHSHYEIFPEIPDDLKEIHRRALAGEVLSGDEEKFVRQDGTVQWLSWEVRPWYTTDNSIGGIIIYSDDVSQRKTVEESLRESEKRFATVFQDSPVALTLVSAADGKFTDVNKAFVRQSGYSRSEVIGRIPSDIGIFIDRTEAEELASAIRNGQASDGREMRVRRKSGEIRTCRFTSGIINISGSPYILSSVEDVTDRKTAEEALKKNEEKYRLLTENSIDIIYSIDLQGTITYVSPQVSRYGYRSEDLLSRNISGFIHEDDLPRLWDDLKTTVATGQSTRTIFRLKNPRGPPIWFEDNGTLIKKDGGTAAGISGVLRDITDRKQTEAALTESEMKLHRLAENAPDMIYRMSLPDGRYEYVSPASVALTGFTPEEFYAEPGLIRKLIHPAWNEYLQNQWQALLENRAMPFYEYQIIDKAGKTRWVNQRNVLITDDQGKAVALEGIVTDVTLQKNTERDLHRSELRSLAVSENAGEWIWEVDTDGIYRYSSPAVTKILGYLPEELVGKKHYYDLFDPSVREQLKAQTFSGFESHEPFRDFINVNRHKNGSPVTLSTSATPVFDENGAFAGYCGVDQDITEHAAAQSALQAMVRSMVGTTGPDSLKKIARNVSSWLQADCVMVGEIQPDHETVKILSMLLDGKEVEDFTYTLRGTPCENASGKGFCIYPDNVRQIFPAAKDLADLDIRGYVGTSIRNSGGEVIGILCALSRSPLKPTSSIREIMDILAVKAAAEIERTWIEQDLRISRQQLAVAMDLAHLANWEYDVATDRFTFDDRFYALYGTTAEREGGTQMPSETYAREFVHPDDLWMVAAEVKKALETTDPAYLSHVEHRIIRRDGRIRNISVRIAVTQDSTGRTIKTHGANQDITERKKTEEELEESRRLLARAMDLATMVNWELDLATGQFVFNDRFYALYHTTAEREGGYRMTPERYTQEFVHPDDRDAVTTAFRSGPASASPGNEFQMEHRIIRRDGEIRHIIVRVGAVADSTGHVVSIHGANQDLTERKRAEEALRKSEEKFRNLVETTPDIIWETDLEGKFRYISPTSKVILGYDPEELAGISAIELVPEEIRGLAQEDLKRFVATSDRIMPFEVLSRHRDGHAIIIEIRIGKIIGPDGKLTGLRGVARDVTERKQADEALRLAYKKLHLLTGITRHDISNQLMALNGFVGVLHKKVKDPAYDPYFARVTEAGKQIAAMIAFTKEYEKIGVHAPVWQALEIIVEEAAKGILPGQIMFHNDQPAGMEIFADPLIVKVFFNLLDNSMRHGQRVTEVRVSSHRSKENLVVVWEDNGIGIEKDDKERIFERGYGKNTGLGMFLAREILSLTGITIRETGEPFVGARFEITVPGGVFRVASHR